MVSGVNQTNSTLLTKNYPIAKGHNYYSIEKALPKPHFMLHLSDNKIITVEC